MEDGEKSTQTGLSKEQKIGFVLLLAFGILSIGLGILQIRNNMYSHFALNNSIPLAIKDQVDTVDALRFRDTDKDGLSDFDELYVYGTSPYLADTDGDGIPDGQEVKLGKNPLCPEGQNCGVSAETVALDALNTTTAMIDQSLTAPTTSAPLDLQSAIQDPAQVRQMLINANVSPDVVNKVSDADLMKMITEIMSSSSVTSNIQSLNNSVILTTGTHQ